MKSRARKRTIKPLSTPTKYASPASYRESLETDVQVSGHWFRICKIDPEVITQYMGVASTDLEKLPEQEKILKSQEINKQIADLVLPACVIYPEMVAGAGDDEHLGVDDLQGFDMIVLLSEIMKFSGLTGEAIEGLQSFR